MSAIGKVKTKLKEGIGEVKESPTRAITHVGIGVAIGAIFDLILEHLMWSGVADWIQSQENIPNALYGFTIFPNNIDAEGTLWMAWDDVILLIITIGMFIFGWFKKGMLYIIGFTIGWYLASYLGLYSSLLKPIFFPEPEETT